MIEARSLSRNFGGETVLRDVTFKITAGERVALLGSNGSGKTTLFRILTTLISPTAGEAWINKSSVTRQSSAVKGCFGFVAATDGGFFPRFTGRENLEFFAGLRKVSPADSRTMITRCSRLPPFEKSLDTPFALCSSGMRQALAIGRALLGQPPVLLLDEPTRSLDPETSALFHGFLKTELRGTTVLFSTHSLEEARLHSDRQIQLREGRIWS